MVIIGSTFANNYNKNDGNGPGLGDNHRGEGGRVNTGK